MNLIFSQIPVFMIAIVSSFTGGNHNAPEFEENNTNKTIAIASIAIPALILAVIVIYLINKNNRK
jgi:heme/copper-type cytochrome/quinol oxidase subunit 2